MPGWSDSGGSSSPGLQMATLLLCAHKSFPSFTGMCGERDRGCSITTREGHIGEVKRQLSQWQRNGPDNKSRGKEEVRQGRR